MAHTRTVHLAPLACVLALTACGASEDASPAGDRGAGPGSPAAPVNAQARLTFEEVSSLADLDFWHINGAFGEKWMPETVGSGGGFLDFDGDGLPDVLLVNSSAWPGHRGENPPARSRLFRNEGNGRFSDVTAQAGLGAPMYGMGAALADYDGDRDVDIFITAVGPNRLLRNEGGSFVDVTATSGLDTGDAGDWSTAALWLDTDRDGWLDLVVCDYVLWTPETDRYHSIDGNETKAYAGPELYDGDTCRLYVNEAGARFRDETERAGLQREGKALGIAAEDFDGDGYPDLVVANDMDLNHLYRNRGDGTFEELAIRAGVATDDAGEARAGMGIDIADLAGDGKLSIAIGNFSYQSAALFTQVADWVFRDRAQAAGLATPTFRTLTFGLEFGDFDLDGALDLMLANGHIEPTVHANDPQVSYAQAPQLFLGDGRGGFVEVSDSVGIPFRRDVVGRGLALSDYDRDGDLDALLTANGGRARLFRNDLEPAGRQWLRLRLVGRAPNTDAVGAVVTVYVGGRTQRRFVGGGGSYLSQSEANPVHFGLDRAAVVDSVLVRWPTTGLISRHEGLAAGQEHRIEEPEPDRPASLE